MLVIIIINLFLGTDNTIFGQNNLTLRVSLGVHMVNGDTLRSIKVLGSGIDRFLLTVAHAQRQGVGRIKDEVGRNSLHLDASAATCSALTSQV